jgi:uncharacterized protein (DUF305 family)
MTTSSRRARARRAAALTVFTAVAAACGRSGDGNAADTAGATGAAATGDTAGHANMPGMTAARDADQEFLRKMSDHHEGLVQMMAPAMQKATSATAKEDATKLHHKQQSEQQQMLGMLRQQYQDSHAPTVMPSNRAMNEDLQRQSGSAYDRQMYQHVIMHHREGMQMIDQFLPRLTKPEVRQMAQKMKEDQTREIAEFERKAGGRT